MLQSFLPPPVVDIALFFCGFRPQRLPNRASMSAESPEQLKASGDAFFRDSHFSEAIEAYTALLQFNNVNKEVRRNVLSNRSCARANCGQFEAAVTDALECIDIDRKWYKGYWRAATAYERLHDLGYALLHYALASDKIDTHGISVEEKEKNKILKQKLLEEIRRVLSVAVTHIHLISTTADKILKRIYDEDVLLAVTKCLDSVADAAPSAVASCTRSIVSVMAMFWERPAVVRATTLLLLKILRHYPIVWRRESSPQVDVVILSAFPVVTTYVLNHVMGPLGDVLTVTRNPTTYVRASVAIVAVEASIFEHEQSRNLLEQYVTDKGTKVIPIFVNHFGFPKAYEGEDDKIDDRRKFFETKSEEYRLWESEHPEHGPILSRIKSLTGDDTFWLSGEGIHRSKKMETVQWVSRSFPMKTLFARFHVRPTACHDFNLMPPLLIRFYEQLVAWCSDGSKTTARVMFERCTGTEIEHLRQWLPNVIVQMHVVVLGTQCTDDEIAFADALGKSDSPVMIVVPYASLNRFSDFLLPAGLARNVTTRFLLLDTTVHYFSGLVDNLDATLRGAVKRTTLHGLSAYLDGPPNSASKSDTPTTSKFHIFISHSGVQKPSALAIREVLEGTHCIPTFVDEPSLVGGNTNFVVFQDAIAGAAQVMLLMSEDFVNEGKSGWPMNELKSAMAWKKDLVVVLVNPAVEGTNSCVSAFPTATDIGKGILADLDAVIAQKRSPVITVRIAEQNLLFSQDDIVGIAKIAADLLPFHRMMETFLDDTLLNGNAALLQGDFAYSNLLLPQFQALQYHPFHEQAVLLDAICEWALETPSPPVGKSALPQVGVLVVHGKGGVGKTRLLIESCTRLRARNAELEVGFLRRRINCDTFLHTVQQGPARRLILVLDYAEHRHDLNELLEGLGKRPNGVTRIILLCRRFDKTTLPASVTVREEKVPTVAAAGAAQFFSAAVRSLWPSVKQRTNSSREDPPLEGPVPFNAQAGTCLELLMAALVVCLRAVSSTTRAADNDTPLKEMLSHEKQTWSEALRTSLLRGPDAERIAVVDGRQLDVEGIERLVVAVSMIGGASLRDAGILFDGLFGPESSLRPRKGYILDVLRRVYPRTNEDIGMLGPDLLTEFVIAKVLSDEHRDEELRPGVVRLTKVLREAKLSDDAVQHAFKMLHLTAVDYPDKSVVVLEAIASHEYGLLWDNDHFMGPERTTNAIFAACSVVNEQVSNGASELEVQRLVESVVQVIESRLIPFNHNVATSMGMILAPIQVITTAAALPYAYERRACIKQALSTVMEYSRSQSHRAIALREYIQQIMLPLCEKSSQRDAEEFLALQLVQDSPFLLVALSSPEPQRSAFLSFVISNLGGRVPLEPLSRCLARFTHMAPLSRIGEEWCQSGGRSPAAANPLFLWAVGLVVATGMKEYGREIEGIAGELGALFASPLNANQAGL